MSHLFFLLFSFGVFYSVPQDESACVFGGVVLKALSDRRLPGSCFTTKITTVGFTPAVVALQSIWCDGR
jgi:hypothetical protein